MSLEVRKSEVPVPEGVVELWMEGVGPGEPPETQLGPKALAEGTLFPYLKRESCAMLNCI